MMRLLSALTFAFPLLASAHNPAPGGGEADIYVRLRASDALKAQLRAVEADITGVDIPNGTVDAILTHQQVALLRARGIVTDFALPKALLRGPDPEYADPAEIEARLKEYASKYPDLASVRVMGKSLEGRDIWAIKISDNVRTKEKTEPVVFFNGMHHAREVMTPEVTMDIVDQLLTGYNTDSKVRRWVDDNEVWVVPMFNVDGSQKVWDGSNMWRKNVRGGYGVDINRNYPYAWKSCNGSSGSRFAQDYRGDAAGSEPETQAMMKFVGEIRPVMSISYHAYSELVIYPYGCRGRRAETATVVEKLGKDIAGVLGYTPGTSWETLYSVDGGDIDWLYNEMQVIPYVIEVSSSREGFQPDYAEWRDKTVEKNRAGWQLMLNRAAGPGIRGVLANGQGSVVEVRDAQNALVQNYRVNPDGSWHVVLQAGTYQLSFKDGERVVRSQTVTVSDKRVNL